MRFVKRSDVVEILLSFMPGDCQKAKAIADTLWPEIYDALCAEYRMGYHDGN